MAEQQLWLTAILNHLFAKPVTSFLEAIGIHPESASQPIPDYFAMELLVAAIIVFLFAWLRGRLSAERPGKIQQLLEILVDETLGAQTEDVIGHGGRRFLPLIATLGLFILICNLIGEVPYLGTPTKEIRVTLGCAFVVFVYYQWWGFRHHGVPRYLKTFLGPVIWIAWLMLPIEIVSHLARLLSLSVRLMANMLAGEKITEIIGEKFLGIGLPVVFMGLHIFVGVLQAYIFVFLTMVYLGGAVSEEH